MKIKDSPLWFYLPSWRRSSKNYNIKFGFNRIGRYRWLIFIDSDRLGKYISKMLKWSSQSIVTVRKSGKFKIIDNMTYKINPKNEDDYYLLFTELVKHNKLPDYILHFWNNVEGCVICKPNREIDNNLYHSFFSILFITQTLIKIRFNKELRIGLITNNLFRVTGCEKLSSPEMSLMLGPSMVINKEFENIHCKNIDFEFSKNDWSSFELKMNQLINEITTKDNEELVAYRGIYRWVSDFERINLENQAKSKIERIKPGGVYLIAGGTGRIGIEIATTIAKTNSVNLVLVKKSIFPKKNKWNNWLDEHDKNDKNSRIINKIKTITRLGSSVEIYNADITSDFETNSLMRELNEKYGHINGIIHAAGSCVHELIKNKNIDISYKVLDPKIFGTINLYKAINRSRLDFFVLLSSINSVFIDAGNFDLCAACNFLDTFANYYNSSSDNFVVSINWPNWKENLEPTKITDEQESDKLKSENFVKEISYSQGLKAFSLILNSYCSQVIVSQIKLHKSKIDSSLIDISDPNSFPNFDISQGNN